MILQVLPLPATPEDPAPFALVLSDATAHTVDLIKEAGALPSKLGARGLLVFKDPVEVR